MNPQLQPIEYDTTLAACDATITTVLNAFCSPVFPISKVHLSYQTTDGKIRKLQEFLDNCITPEKSKCGYKLSDTSCEGIKEIIPTISELHLFIDIFFWEGEENSSKNRSSETTEQVKMKLCDIPQILIHNSVTYELRGVISFHLGKSKLRNTIGHYNGYAKRGTGSWDLFDDLKKKPIPTKASKIVPVETLMYTI
ncbi:unnamed protein product [Macrosiphum euphorbiae]|uniref:USP domain-containing protein n=1 Tax=Macrosiphum euphorbiae TaxID=13131 RepID=A0AAV0YDN2_9HEMI|nr:unnamed protein product [Macrosiphum euphorbiae]